GFANAFTSVAGADGGSLSYALTVNGAASGLVDSQTGQNVVLVLNNGVVEGHVGASDGLLSFTLAVDSTGHVTLTQDRAVSQADAASPDTGEGVGLAHGVVNLVGTITDGDGDTASASIDLGAHVAFTDDGPTAFNDANAINPGEFGPSTGNVIAGTGLDSDGVAVTPSTHDVVGADGATVTSVTALGTESDAVTVAAAGSVQIQGEL